MDVKPPNAHYPAIVPVAYQRAIRLSQRMDLTILPSSPDDIVDCIDIRTDGPLQTSKHITGYKPSNNTLIKGKGTIVDILI